MLALALPAIAALPAGSSCDYEAFPGDNFGGTNLPDQPVSSTLSTAAECAALCCAAAAANCTAFTLNAGAPGARMCFLKSAITHTPNPGCESGVINGTAPPPPPPPPSCALNNGTPCAAAPWATQWNLTLSTTCYPDHETGFFVPRYDQPWGLLPISWTNAMDVWKRDDPFQSSCEAAMLEGCRIVKAASEGLTRSFRYNNMELAIAFLASNREVMDAAHASWFLQYIDPATGKGNGTVYSEGVGVWFWDYRVPEVRAHVVAMVVAGAADAAYDGTFTDDEIGFPVEHEGAPALMGMADAQTADVRHWAQVTSGVVIDALLAANKYAFQAFFDGSFDGGNVGPAPTRATCAAFRRRYCAPSFQNGSLTMALDVTSLTQTLAGFLIVRGPSAFLGFGWSSGQETWRPEFLWEVGEPQSLCAETSPGVFSRAWTYGDATLNCSDWTATVPARTT